MVLLAGDEERISILAYLLKTNCFHLIRASDPLEAEKQFLKNPVIDLVIIRFMNPDTSVQLTENLKRLDSRVPIILFEASSDAANALLNKSNSAGELLETIKDVTRRKRGPQMTLKRQLSAALSS